MIIGIIGKPRSGKTTYSAAIVQKNKRKLKICKHIPFLRHILHPYDVIYCTDPTISDTTTIDYAGLGAWKPARNSLIILEEAGIGLDNRAWKALSKDAAYLFALHGHIGCDIIWSSQTVDVDKKLFARTHNIYICHRRGPFSSFTPVSFTVDVDSNTHQLVDAYDIPKGFAAFLSVILRRTPIIFRPRYYRYFDSFVDDHIYTLDTPI